VAEYQLTTNPEMVLRVADQVWIPLDGSNSDYHAYLQWLDEGNTPDPAPPDPAAQAQPA
jgi:hypothetical protein